MNSSIFFFSALWAANGSTTADSPSFSKGLIQQYVMNICWLLLLRRCISVINNFFPALYKAYITVGRGSGGPQC